ncbi:neprilysin-1 isoform X1 [Orussus abietinus]|uniref:neprilysin-1 isoform X1 n=1 Tax=Orussus abietinus TaxID=222816 RepID=UPI000C715C2C|nr:neprilysin-1 isoform X1 [Orussus abietinus]
MIGNIYIACAVIAVVCFHATISSILPENYPVCPTAACREIADDILRNINENMDPCTDFYDFACGNWPKHNPIPPGEDFYQQFMVASNRKDARIKAILEGKPDLNENPAVEKARKVFAACLDTEATDKTGFKILASILVQNGGWPAATEEWDSSSWTWQAADNYYNSFIGLFPLYQIAVQPDSRINGTVLITLQLPDVKFKPIYSILVNRNLFFKEITAYKHYIEKLIVTVANATGSQVSQEQVASDAHAIVDFESKFFKLVSETYESPLYYEMMNISYLQEYYDVADPKNESGKINWLSSIQALFKEISRTIDGSQMIIMDASTFLLGLAELLDKSSPRTLVNYIHFKFVDHMAKHTTEKVREYIADLNNVLVATESQKLRWKQCLHQNEMSHVVSYEYIKRYFPEHSKAAALKMIDDIKTQLELQIQSASWMTQEIKLAAIEKLKNVKEYIGYPDWYSNETAVYNYYNEPQVPPGQPEDRPRKTNDDRPRGMLSFTSATLSGPYGFTNLIGDSKQSQERGPRPDTWHLI